MGKSFPKIIMVLTLIFSSFLMFNTVSYTTSDNGSNLEFTFNSPNKIMDDEVIVTNFQETPYEEYLGPQAARTGAQSFAVILCHFSDYGQRWTQVEHEGIMQTIDDYWFNATYGLMWIDWVVEGWYDLGHNMAHYGHLDAWGTLVFDKNWHELVDDAVALADGDINFSNYDNLIIVLGDIWWRGVSTLGTQVNIDTDEGNFNKEATVVGEQDTDPIEEVWGRIAHEMGHCFLLRHTHGSGGTTQKNYASYYSLMARAYPSACSVYTQLIDNHAGWFNAATNQMVVAGGGGGTWTVRPRHLNIGGDIQALKVEISSTQYYRVEVIKQQSEDAWLPDEGVLIYYVDEGANDNDECTDQDSTPGSDPDPVDDLIDCLYDVGQTFTDTGNGITITVNSATFDGYSITVTNSAGGTPDLMINEWGNPPGYPGPWESIDIYIDSPVNGWNWYRHNDGTGTNPVGNGDDPLLNHANRLYAKISNIGDADASGVVVRFYENTPIGAGASGSWNLIDTVTGLTIVKGTTQAVYVDWTPTHSVSPTDTGIMDMHSCVKVVIEDHILEDNTGNNDAQENIDFFEVVAGSPMPNMMTAEATYGTVSKEFTIVNPWKETKEIHINVLGVTSGWIVTGNGIGEFHNFTANEAKVFKIDIIPGPDVRVTDKVEADLVASTNVIYDYDDDFIGDMHLMPFGGVTLTATVMYQSKLNIDATIRDENTFNIIGELSYIEDVPQQHLPQAEGDRTVYLLIEEVNTGFVETANVVTDPYGDFEYEVTGKTGLFAINAYFAGTGYVTSAASVTLMVDLNASSVWTSTRTGLFPGFTFYLTLSSIVSLCVIVVVKRRRK